MKIIGRSQVYGVERVAALRTTGHERQRGVARARGPGKELKN